MVQAAPEGMEGTRAPSKNELPPLDSPAICLVNWLFFFSMNLIRILYPKEGERRRGIFSNHERENVVRREVWTGEAHP